MRITPLEPDEFRAALRAVKDWEWEHGPATDQWARSYTFLLRTLWHTGMHPSVLFRDEPKAKAAGPRARFDADSAGWVIEWRRPKTGEWCVMPIPDDLRDELAWWLSFTDKPASRTVRHNFTQIGEKAGIDGLSPKLLRYTVGYRLWKAEGPDTVQKSLGVSNAVMRHYVKVDDGDRVRRVRAALAHDDQEAGVE